MIELACVKMDQREDSLLLQCQGGFLPRSSTQWRIGELSLSARCVAFTQKSRGRIELPLAGIAAVSTERRKFILARKQVIRLSYVLADSDHWKNVWIITPNLNAWFKKLANLSGAGQESPLDESDRFRHVSTAPLRDWAPMQGRAPKALRLRKEQVRELAATVVPRGARILWYLWQHRHADIEELSRLVDASPDLDVLALLDEEINGNAHRLFGGSALQFQERTVDPTDGRMILFSWWLDRCDPQDRAEEVVEPQTSILDSASPFVDIHDEGDTLLVVVKAPAVKAETLSAQVRGKRVLLAAETSDGPCEFSICLPCAVVGPPARTAFSNALLSLWLAKKPSKRMKIGAGTAMGQLPVPTPGEEDELGSPLDGLGSSGVIR